MELYLPSGSQPLLLRKEKRPQPGCHSHWRSLSQSRNVPISQWRAELEVLGDQGRASLMKQKVPSASPDILLCRSSLLAPFSSPPLPEARWTNLHPKMETVISTTLRSISKAFFEQCQWLPMVPEFLLYLYNFVYLCIFWLCWVLHCCTGFSLVAASRGYSLVAVHGLLFEVASLVSEHGL